jgi:hypothetical protein
MLYEKKGGKQIDIGRSEDEKKVNLQNYIGLDKSHS